MAQIIPTSQKRTKDKKRIEFLATGKRKNSIARVRLSSGDGTMVINERPLSTYFGRATLQMLVRQPFEETGTAGKFNVNVNVCGGGLSGQAGAVRHGISRALLKMNLDLRKPLKTAGFLTRDAREKERRKVGCRKARRRPQYSKR